MRQKRSYGRVLVVSTLVGCLEVVLTIVVVLVYVQTQPPQDEPPDWVTIGGSLVATMPLVGFIAFVLSLVFVVPAVALADLIVRGLGGRAAWWAAVASPPAVAALLAAPVLIYATHNDTETESTLLFWASATALLSLGALIALPLGEGLVRRVALWGAAAVVGTAVFGALGLAVGLAYEPPRIGPQTMPGTWIDETRGTLVFTADGRVEASGVGVHRRGDRPGEPYRRCSGSGTWFYEPGHDVWSQRVRVEIPVCHWQAWHVDGTGQEPRISQEVGDPGSGLLYKLRKASDRTSRGT